MSISAQQLLDRLNQLAKPVLAELGLELVELQFRREKNGWVLRLVIDRAQGVSVDDCARASREIDTLLEIEGLIDHAFTLEVSSPGLDRPLKSLDDFRRCLGRKVRVVTREPIENQQVIVGVIDLVGDDAVRLRLQKDTVSIPVANMVRARLEIEF